MSETECPCHHLPHIGKCCCESTLAEVVGEVAAAKIEYAIVHPEESVLRSRRKPDE